MCSEQPRCKKVKLSNDLPVESSPNRETVMTATTHPSHRYPVTKTKDALLLYAHRNSQVPALYSSDSVDGRGLFINTMTSIGDELYVCPLRRPSGDTRHHRAAVNLVFVYDAASLAWKRDMVIPFQDCRARIVRLQACPTTGYLYVIVLPHGDDWNYRGGPEAPDVYTRFDVYQINIVTNEITGYGNVGSSAYRTVTAGKKVKNLVFSTCDEDGSDVKLVEVSPEGKPERFVRLNGIKSHKLLSNVHLAADNESYVVASEVDDEDGPEKIAIFRIPAVGNEARNKHYDYNLAEIEAEEVDSYTTYDVYGSLILDTHDGGDILVMEMTADTYRLRLLRYDLVGGLQPGSLVGIIGPVSAYPGPCVACYNSQRGLLYWQSRYKFQVFRLWCSDVVNPATQK